MKIFDDGDKTIDGLWDNCTGQFDYLNRSKRSEAAFVRKLVEEMFARYPEDGKFSLRSRLRSRSDTQHLGAFFELVIHDLLLACGCTIVAVEPAIPGTRNSPDFLVEAADGSLFYLEATLATGKSDTDAAAERRLEQAIARINRIVSTDFFLGLDVSGTPSAMISGKRLQHELQTWVDALSPEAVAAAWLSDNFSSVDFIYTEHGCRISVTPIPRRPSTEPVQRPVGVRMIGGGWLKVDEDIRAAVKGKATRYGNLNAPYIIAINALDNFANEESSADGLLGSLCVITGGGKLIEARGTDGVWLGAKGPTNTGVSAVMTVDRLTPWSLARASSRVFYNPFARSPLTDIDLGVTRIVVNDGRIRRYPGRSIGDILGLPGHWPEPSEGSA